MYCNVYITSSAVLHMAPCAREPDHVTTREELNTYYINKQCTAMFITKGIWSCQASREHATAIRSKCLDGVALKFDQVGCV